MVKKVINVSYIKLSSVDFIFIIRTDPADFSVRETVIYLSLLLKKTIFFSAA